MRYSILFIIILNQLYSRGQILINEVDTVDIQKNQSAVGYGVYQKIWFSHNYSFKNSTASHQDSLVYSIDTTKRIYFKVYNAKNDLIIEGQKAKYSNHFEGPVKFYKANKQLFKIEYWLPHYALDTLEKSYYLSDGPIAIRTEYLDHFGKVKKEHYYDFILDMNDPKNYRFIKRKRKY